VCPIRGNEGDCSRSNFTFTNIETLFIVYVHACACQLPHSLSETQNNFLPTKQIFAFFLFPCCLHFSRCQARKDLRDPHLYPTFPPVLKNRHQASVIKNCGLRLRLFLSIPLHDLETIRKYYKKSNRHELIAEDGRFIWYEDFYFTLDRKGRV